jgi:hypothetical protein
VGARGLIRFGQQRDRKEARRGHRGCDPLGSGGSAAGFCDARRGSRHTDQETSRP